MDKNKKVIFAEDALLFENKIYFVARDMNAMCTVDIYTEELKIIGKIPEENIAVKRLSTILLMWREKIIVVPAHARDLWLYDIRKAHWEKVELDNTCCSYYKFWNAEIYNDKLILLGGRYPYVVCVDLNIMEVRYIDIGCQKLLKNVHKNIEGFFERGTIRKGNLLYLVSKLEKRVLVFDMDLEVGDWLLPEMAPLYFGMKEESGKKVNINENGEITVFEDDICIARVIPQMDEQKIEAYILSDGNVLKTAYYESNIIDLDMYKSFICKMDVSGARDKSGSNIGFNIYQTLKKL